MLLSKLPILKRTKEKIKPRRRNQKTTRSPTKILTLLLRHSLNMSQRWTVDLVLPSNLPSEILNDLDSIDLTRNPSRIPTRRTNRSRNRRRKR